eukprot:SAG11_NODE_24113_length_378_cov_0.551971_1_plen_46_part_10
MQHRPNQYCEPGASPHPAQSAPAPGFAEARGGQPEVDALYNTLVWI